MNQTHETLKYTLADDEKAVKVVVYTSNLLIRGDLVVKKIIRVSTWLRTNTAPDWIGLYNTKALVTGGDHNTKPTAFTEMHIDCRQIEAFHMLPPAQDPPDYDPTEPNRRMFPVVALLGGFRIEANLRLAIKTDLRKFLEVNRETFTPLYDARISNTLIPSIGVLAVPYLLVRQESVIFSIS